MALLNPPSATLLEEVKKGRRLYGGIYETKRSKTKIYLAYRDRKEYFRGGEACVSDAVRLGKACWAVDHDTIIRMGAKKVDFIGVLMKDGSGTYLTHIDNFRDRTKSTYKNYTGRGGALQIYLPLQFFAYKRGIIKL